MQPALIASVRFRARHLYLVLGDGREIGVPLERFPRLRDATPAQRARWQITAFGTGVRWPNLDEDIGLAGVLGIPEDLVDEAAGFEVHRRRT
jgi:hypothetical protein